MTDTAAVAAELEILTAALDEPGADVAHSMRQVALTAAAVIGTYLGLSVHVAGSDPPFHVTALVDGVTATDIRTSLRVVLPSEVDVKNRLTVAVHLYAGSAGAFVDLAADMSWLTGRPPSDFVLDRHLGVPTSPEPAMQLRAASLINQAVGVLIARGYTPQRADAELDAQAAHTGTDRHTAARLILAELTVPEPDAADWDLGIP